MISNVIDNIYFLVMSGLCVSALIAALLYWYAVYVDLKQKAEFDEKYRASRNVDSSWN